MNPDGPPLLLPHMLYDYYVLRPRTPPNSEGGRPVVSSLTPSPLSSPIPEYPTRRKISEVPSPDDQTPYPATMYDSKTYLLLVIASKKLELLKLDREREEALEQAEWEWMNGTVQDGAVERVLQKWEEYKEATLSRQALLGYRNVDSDSDNE